MGCDVLAFLDTKNDVDSKLSTLKKLRAHISEIQQRCRTLEEELAAENRPVGSIRAVPSEVLLIIFGYCIKGNSRSIHRLMVVCRQWHDIAIGNPHFWTTMVIPGYLYEGNFERGATLLGPYIKACVKRSGNFPLRLDLDFNNIISLPNRMETDIVTAIGGTYPNLSHDKIFNWVEKQDWSWCTGEDAEDAPGHYSHLLHLIPLMAPTERWESLKITYPDDFEMADELLLRLAEPMPNLKSLSLSEHPDGDVLNPIESPFTDLPSLESLKVSSLQALNFVHPPSSLKHLKIVVNLDLKSVEALNQLSGLRTLTLSPRSSRYAIVAGSELISLQLPKLHTLTLVKLPRYNPQLKYELPELRNLLLTDNTTGYDNLPDVQPTHVHCNLIGYGDHDVGSVEKILAKYTTARIISTKADRKNDVLEAIKQLKEGGNLNAALEKLMFEDGFGLVEEVIHIEKI